eukprot:scaffold1490_cov162-Ochromonas_danica.AAC.37
MSSVEQGTSQTSSTPPQKKKINWAPQLEQALAASTLKFEAFKRTARPFDEKWGDVAFDLNTSESLQSFLTQEGMIDAEDAKRKFLRMKQMVNKKYALEAEGANLSELPENIE